MRAISLVPMLAGLVLGATKPPKATTTELEGTWRMVSCVHKGGTWEPEDDLHTFVCAGSTCVSRFGGKQGPLCTFSIEKTTSPKHIDIVIDEWRDAGKKIRGIYELKSDTLTICQGAVDAQRPTEFTSTSSDGQCLCVYKRVRRSFWRALFD